MIRSIMVWSVFRLIKAANTDFTDDTDFTDRPIVGEKFSVMKFVQERSINKCRQLIERIFTTEIRS